MLDCYRIAKTVLKKSCRPQLFRGGRGSPSQTGGEERQKEGLCEGGTGRRGEGWNQDVKQ